MDNGVAGRLLADGDPHELIDMGGLVVSHDDEPSKDTASCPI
jgi:hypothetical protein